MVATMRDIHRVNSSRIVASRLTAEPLCIAENRLAGDLLPPDSPNMAKMTCDTRLLSSPTSVVLVLDSVSKDSHDGKQKKKDKKKKLFRNRRKSPKDKEVEIDAARREELRRQALRLKYIREEEDADFHKIRGEEETSPKLDMLPRYPLTLMEEVLSTPTTVPVESDDDEDDEKKVPDPDEVPEVKVLDLGRFETQVHELRLSKMDLRQFVSHNGNFERLQEALRASKAITDETLRQKLHELCRSSNEGQHGEETECRDIFSTKKKDRGWNTNLPSAYRRMNEFTTEIDWLHEIEKDPTIPKGTTREGTKTKKNWSDVKLLKRESNDSQKGRDPYHLAFQHGVEESAMLTCDDKNLKDGVDLLTYCVYDLVPIVQEQEVFANLQKELRNIGAVTNEMLKQGLHFYVRDVRLQRQRREAEMRAMEEKECGGLNDQAPAQTRGPMRRAALLEKLRLRARKKQCHY